VEDLSGLRPHGEQGVVAEDSAVAVGGALLLLAVHLTDRRVEVDHRLLAPRPGTERPGPPDRLGDHRVELANVPEGEGAQERAERRGGHHPKRQDLLRRSGRQSIGVVDVGRPRQDRRHQRQHLATGQCPTDSSPQAHNLVDEGFEPEADHQRGRDDQPAIGHESGVVEGHRDAVGHAR
jgi:hypothetical protein